MSMENRKSKVCIISMPFMIVEYPTIGVPLLLRILRDKGIDCSAFYFAELFQEAASRETYDFILADSGDNELSEWMFSRKTFGIDNDYLSNEYTTEKDRLLEVRDQFESIIDDLSDKDWGVYDAIGFSCTFIQLVPSLCLSKHIKHRYPDVEIILGGGNMLPDLSKEVLQNCSWIDTIFVGEAEKSLPHYLETGQTDIEGIMRRDGDDIDFSGSARTPSRDIQDLPMPDFSDYFATTGEEKKLSMQIGRGCIYNKCNFCVYCDHTSYRKGSIDRTMEQMKHIVETHDIKDVCFVDLIVPPSVFKKLPNIPGVKYNFCISSFTWSYDHLPYLSGHNCTIGIENFHPEILKLMNKEQSTIECISILKWLKHYDVNVAWQFLYGAVNEKGEWYDYVYSLLRHLTHLQPPLCTSSITHHRDNTYLTDNDFRECSAYEHIYPSSFNLRKMARVFEVNSAQISMQQIQNWSHINRVLDLMKKWRFDYISNPACLYRRDNLIIDARYGKTRRIELSKPQIDILESCAYPTKEDLECNPEDMQKLVANHLVLNMEDQYLTLVDPTTPLREIPKESVQLPILT